MNVLNKKYSFGAVLLIAVMCAASFAVVFADGSDAENDGFEQASYVEGVKLTEENLALTVDYYKTFTTYDIAGMIGDSIAEIFGNLDDSDFTISDIVLSGNGTISMGMLDSFDGSVKAEKQFRCIEDRDVTFRITFNEDKNVFDTVDSGLTRGQLELIRAVGFDAAVTDGSVYTGSIDFTYNGYSEQLTVLDKVGDDRFFISEKKVTVGEGYSTAVKIDGIFGKGISIDIEASEYEGNSEMNYSEADVSDLKIGDVVCNEKKWTDRDVFLKCSISYDGKDFLHAKTDMFDADKIRDYKTYGYLFIEYDYEIDMNYETTPAKWEDETVVNPYSAVFAQHVLDQYGATVRTDASGFRDVADDVVDGLKESEDRDNLPIYAGAAGLIIVAIVTALLLWKRN